ncbi:MAG TPA: secondary thiamine-phosphate synthase enzyme YjbQ [Candidatus Binatia bacterium]|jgi:secondary thiamine-phosphate synthase enzyme
MTKFEVVTKRKRQVIDITELCKENLSELKSRRSGVCHLFVLHTTAALTIADLDPGTDLDLLDALDAIIPELKYRHPHDPGHVSDHILSSLIGTSLTVAIDNGEIVLGTWQRIILLEFDGPRTRQIALSFVSETLPK